jgi:hypothetical protein
MPEIALVPDISGVCNWDGTLLMSSTPRKMASTKTKNKRPKDMGLLLYFLTTCDRKKPISILEIVFVHLMEKTQNTSTT